MLRVLIRILLFYLIFRFISNLIRLVMAYFNRRPAFEPQPEPVKEPSARETIVDAEFTDI